MIRPAKTVEVFDLVDLLRNVHGRTVYRGLEMDCVFARKMFAQFIQRHGGSHDGGTCLFVHERKGVICGFVAGMLDRVYHVGEPLWASDVFLHVREGEPPMTSIKLLKAYVEWAEGNPNVYEVRLSSSYASPEGKDAEVLYERLGFEESGKTFSKINPRFGQERKDAA